MYLFPNSLKLAAPTGVVHAKCVIAHEATLFVTSANLTEPPVKPNIDIGELMRARMIALAAARHFRGLIDRGTLQPLPNRPVRG